MCTVTFIPGNKTAYITHNRDERNLRTKALAPGYYHVNGSRLLFPKDGKAGGSWVGMNERGHAAVLLNGAFTNHEPLPPYRRSRGLVFLDILSAPDLLIAFRKINLYNIEPFTMILWNGADLSECRWDGSKKHFAELDPTRYHLWSSSTLYDQNVMEKRLSWFKLWRDKHPHPELNEIIQFHLQGGEGDQTNDLRMNRDGELSTLSVTAMEISRLGGKMRYIDLADFTSFDNTLVFNKTVVESQ